MKKVFLGDKYYTHKEGELIIVRVIRFKNDKKVIIRNEETKEVSNCTTDELLNEWTRLKPSGKLTFSIALLDQKVKDVIVALFRTEELEANDGIPYCVCRQNSLDVFTNQTNTNPNMTYVGVSVSKDTCPEDINFMIMLACNGIVENEAISMYLDDTLDTVLPLLRNEDKYDQVLLQLKQSIVQIGVSGYCNNLKQLLQENNFMYDVNRAFKVETIPCEMQLMDEVQLIPEIRMHLENELKVEMFKTYVIPYDYTINLKGIKREHVIVRDKNNKLYVVAYDKGEYLNKAYRDNIKDKRDAVMMFKLKNKKHNEQ